MTRPGGSVAGPAEVVGDPTVGSVAVTGLAVRAPGAADVETFWRRLVDGRLPPKAVDSGGERLDPAPFGMTEEEVDWYPPETQVFLAACHAALECAGHDPRSVPGRVGVFGQTPTGHSGDPAREVARRLGLSGPAVTVPGGGVSAVHLAWRSVCAGECDTAVAGGPIGPAGAAVVVLKQLPAAYHDGDHIRAVLLASAVRHPDPVPVGGPADGSAVAAAMAAAGVDPTEVDYLPLIPAGAGGPGDPAALPGVTGVVTAVLALEREAVPPVPGAVRPDREAVPPVPGAVRPDRLGAWRRTPERRRVAGVSWWEGARLGHMLLAEGPPAVAEPTDGRPRIVVWSAGDRAAEGRLRSALGRFFTRHVDGRFADAVATLQHGRGVHRVRAAAVCRSAAAAAAALAGESEAAPVLTGECGDGTPGGPVRFLVPDAPVGTGGLATGLYGTVRAFTVPIDECLELFEEQGIPLHKRWTMDPPELIAADPLVAGPVRFAISYALSAMWRAAGVEPAGVVGTGAAELTAAAVAGALGLPDAVRLVAARAASLAEGPDPGTAVSTWDRSTPDALIAPPTFPVHSALPADQSTGALLVLGSDDDAPGSDDASGGAARVVTSLADGRDDEVAVLTAAARLWTWGCPVDWTALDQPRPVVRVALPGYPHQSRRPTVPAGGRVTAPAGPEPAHAPAVRRCWEEAPTPVSRPDPAAAALLLLPDRAADAGRIAQAVAEAGWRPVRVRPGDRYVERAGEFWIRPERPADLARLLQRLADQGTAPAVVVHATTCGGAAHPEPEDTRFGAGYRDLAATARAVGDETAGWVVPPRLLLLTRGAVDVSGSEPVDTFRAGLPGVLRAALTGSPVPGRVIDVDARVPAAVLARELAAETGEPLVALRGHRRWLPVERAVPVPGSRPPRLRPRGVYLLTGTASASTPVVARGLAGAAPEPRLGFVGPGAADLPAEMLVELRARGVQVAVHQCDLTTDALDRAVAGLTARWGPVDGVFHLALPPPTRSGSTSAADGPADAAAAPAAWAAEVRALERVFAHHPALDFAVFLTNGDELPPADPAAGSPLAGGRVVSATWPARTVPSGSTGRAPGRPAGGDPVPATTVTNRDESPGPALVWEREVGEDTDWALDEHRLGTVPLLPTGSYVEFVLRALDELAGRGDGAVTLSPVEFPTPLLAADPRLLRVVLRPVTGGYNLTVESRPTGGVDGDPLIHVRGRLRVDDPTAAPQVDLADLRARFEAAGHREPVPAAPAGLTRGPRWRSVTDGRGRDEERLMPVELPASYHPELDTYPVHPALLDAALTTMGAPGGRRPGPVRAGAAPAGCRTLRVHAPLPGRFVVHSRPAPGGGWDGDLIAEDGTLLVRVEGLRWAPVGDDPGPPADPVPPADDPGSPADPARPGGDPDVVGTLLGMLDAGVTGSVLVRR